MKDEKGKIMEKIKRNRKKRFFKRQLPGTDGQIDGQTDAN